MYVKLHIHSRFLSDGFMNSTHRRVETKAETAPEKTDPESEAQEARAEVLLMGSTGACTINRPLINMHD